MKKISKLLALAVVFHGLPACAGKEPPVSEAAPAASSTEFVSLRKGSAGSYLAGQFARNRGDIDMAIRYLRRAQQHNPDNGDIAGQLQALLLLNGNIPEAVQLVKKQSDPQSALAALLLSLDALKRGQLEDAKTILTKSQPLSNGQLWQPLMLAWIDASRHALTQPVRFDDMNTEATQGSALANYHLALINNEAGFAQEAAENFKKSIADPNSPPERVMNMLMRFYDNNKSPATLKPTVEAYRKRNPDANNELSEDIGKVFTLQDGVAEVLFTMGTVMQGAGADQDAILYLQLASYLKPNFPLATLGIGDAYTNLKQYDKANAQYSLIDEKSQLYMRARLRLAINESQMGNFAESINRLDKLSAALPNQYEPLVAKADLLRAKQYFKEAAEAYTAALARVHNPQAGHWPLFFARGVCFDRQDKWELAEQDFQKALALKPEQPDVLNYLGYGWLVRQEHVDEAREMIERALALKPNDPQIADSMGWALYSMGKYEEALTYLEKALELLPADPVVNDHLGDVYWQLGRRMEARFQWEKSLDFSPAQADADATRRKLQDGLALDMQPDATPAFIADTAPPDRAVQ